MFITVPLSAPVSTPTAHLTFEFHHCCVATKWRIRASSSSAASGVDLTTQSAISNKDSNAVKEALDQLTEVGWGKKWSSQPYVSRCMTSVRELTTLGIKNAEHLAIPSVRNDVSSFADIIAGPDTVEEQINPALTLFCNSLPNLDNNVWKIYLWVEIINRLLETAFGGFASFFPDYQERISRHEAAHFIVAYLLGLPILGYSLDIGKEHVNLIDEKLEKLIFSGQLDAKELDRIGGSSCHTWLGVYLSSTKNGGYSHCHWVVNWPKEFLADSSERMDAGSPTYVLGKEHLIPDFHSTRHLRTSEHIQISNYAHGSTTTDVYLLLHSSLSYQQVKGMQNVKMLLLD